MVQYIVRRFLNLIPVWVGVLVITFLIMHLTPGDPAYGRWSRCGSRNSPGDQGTTRLDQPLLVQFTRYVGNVLRGLWPILSHRRTRLVRNQLALSQYRASVSRFTLRGHINWCNGRRTCARYPYSLLDNVSMVIALIGISTPVFWLGLILMYVFGVQLGWLPTGGSGHGFI